jgi:cell division protease FtsH
VTQQLPEDDRYHYSKTYLVNRLSVALGGRVAEKAVFSDLSTGAQNDLKVVNELAEKMVCVWGMSDKIGAMTFRRGEEHPFLGRKLAEEKTFSEQMAWLIDQEIAAVIREAEVKAEDIIAGNRDKLDVLVEALIDEETLDGKRIDQLLGLG